MKLKRRPSRDVIISNREVVSSAFGYIYGQQKDSTLFIERHCQILILNSVNGGGTQKYGAKHSCDDGDRREYSGKGLSQCNFIHQNSHTNGPGVDVGIPRIEAGD
jgi:hypothetical protein